MSQKIAKKNMKTNTDIFFLLIVSILYFQLQIVVGVIRQTNINTTIELSNVSLLNDANLRKKVILQSISNTQEQKNDTIAKSVISKGLGNVVNDPLTYFNNTRKMKLFNSSIIDDDKTSNLNSSSEQSALESISESFIKTSEPMNTLQEQNDRIISYTESSPFDDENRDINITFGVNNTYNSTLSFSSLGNSLDILSTISFHSTHMSDVNESTSIFILDKLDTTTLASVSEKLFPIPPLFESNNVNEQIINRLPISNSTMEYEFIGLNSTTIQFDNQDIANVNNLTLNINSSSFSKSSLDSTVSSFIIINSTLENPNIKYLDRYISNINLMNSTVSNIYSSALISSTAVSYNLNDDLINTDQSTSLPDTTTFIPYPPMISSATTNEDMEMKKMNSSIQSTISSTSSISTINKSTIITALMPSSKTFLFGTTDDISTVINNNTIVFNDDDDITTANTIQISPDMVYSIPQDVKVFVRIVVETNWLDVCPQLFTLRQSLADILSSGMDKIVLAKQIIFQKNPCMDLILINNNITSIQSIKSTTFFLYIVDQNGNFDLALTKVLPNLYEKSTIKVANMSIRSFQLVEDSDSSNAIAVIVVSCVAFICLVLLTSLLFIMRKRQTRFKYGERCRPVSLDAYSLDNVSAHNSFRHKGGLRMSKRSYGNPTFEDSTISSHPLNFAGLLAFSDKQNAIFEEYNSIPQVLARIDELPVGADMKNRYANVIPLPETRVPLRKINGDPSTEYINASYVRGPKNVTKHYIGCQAPIAVTVIDFWRMIWEQQSKVIIMLTDLIENGIEKCAEYIPLSEVTDCSRIYGNFQIILKKRETKEKYAISLLHLKNTENNMYREISHIWYLWPVNGIPTDAVGMIAVLLEARALQRGGIEPIVVHCSSGTGRTGTIIALDLAIRQYEITRTVDIPRIVCTIRKDRAGAVQTKEQYFFIYKALNLYAAKLAGENLDTT